MALIGASNSLGGLSGSNAFARLLVVVSGDTRGLSSSLAQANGTIAGFSKNAESIGNALIRSLTLPLLAIGGASIKMAADYQAAIARVAGLTPILEDTGMTMDQLSQSILDLASDPSITAGPTELADALYFAGSAGLDFDKAMDVVKLSAQGASIGMGEAADISKVLIAALNNFSGEGLTATRAMDSLTVAIKEGTAAPEELAVALGRLLPIAAQAGVTFEEVVGSVAALTNLGVPARVATTSLRALFSQLLAPTIAATERLNELGITADQLRYKLQKGPIEAFQLLTKATHGDSDALREIIPQIRGLTAFYGLTGQRLKDYKGILEATEHPQRALAEAMGVVMETAGFKFDKAMQSIQIAAISLGNTLLPVFEKVISVVQDVAEAFTGLEDPVKSAFAAFLIAGIVVGPLFKLLGVLTSVREASVAYQAAGIQMVPTLRAISTGFILVGVAALSAYGGFKSLLAGATGLTSVLTTFAGTIVAVGVALKGLQTLANASRLVNGFTLALTGLSTGAIAGIAITIGAIVTAIGYIAGASARADAKISQLSDALLEGAKSGTTLRDALNQVSDEGIRTTLQQIADQMRIAGVSVGDALKPLQEGIGGRVEGDLAGISQELANMDIPEQVSDPLNEAINAFNDARASGQSFGEALQSSGVLAGEFGTALDSIGGSGQAVGSALGDSASDAKTFIAAFLGASGVLHDFNQAQTDSLVLQGANQQAIADFARKEGVSVDYIQRGAEELGFTFAGASKQGTDSFKRLYFGTKHNGDLISGKMAEIREAVSTAATEIHDDFAGMFSVFEAFPKDTTKNFDVYLQRIQDVRDASIQSAVDIQKLGQRGVPLELLKELEAEGPAMIHRFATASDKELQQYVRAFEIHLAAGDEAVLKEGVHLKSKGRNNIQGFVEAMLTSTHLSEDAGRKIIQAVSNGLDSGSLKPEAIQQVSSFVAGLARLKNVSQAEAEKATLALIQELQKPRSFNASGKLMVNRVAEGIAAATGIPVQKVQAMMQALQGKISEKKSALVAQGRDVAASVAAGMKSESFVGVGTSWMSQAAAGLASATDVATAAARGAALQVRLAFNQGLQGSPKFSSYYDGMNFAKQFAEGFDHEKRHVEKLDFRRPSVKVHPGSRVGHRGHDDDRHGHRRKIDLDVRIDRVKYAKDTEYAYRAEGW